MAKQPKIIANLKNGDIEISEAQLELIKLGKPVTIKKGKEYVTVRLDDITSFKYA